MKMNKFYAPLATLLLAGAVFTACSSDDATQEVVPANKNWSLQIDAASFSKETRALEYQGLNSGILSEWKIGELMEVYNVSDNDSYRGKLTPKQEGFQSPLVTTDEGLTGDFNVGDALKIYYPKREQTYQGQDGTFETISKDFDYSSVSVTITEIDKENRAMKATSASSRVQFVNQQAICRFEFVDAQGAPIEDIQRVVISGVDLNNAAAIVQKRNEATNLAELGDIEINVDKSQSDNTADEQANVIWVALRCNENVKLTFTVVTSEKTYRATSQEYLEINNGQQYNTPVTLKELQN